MTRARKRHMQEPLFDRRGRARVRDGKRLPKRRHKKPGRKPKGHRAGSAHKTRPELTGREPIHVVLRVVAAQDDVNGLPPRELGTRLVRRTSAMPLGLATGLLVPSLG